MVARGLFWPRDLCTYHYDALHRKGDLLASKRAFAKAGSGSTDSKGYRRIKVKGKDIKEHRLVMEKHLGRPLLPTENVHHKDGNRSNNSLDNLEIWVTPQPMGQRVSDKVGYACKILHQYADYGKPETPVMLNTGKPKISIRNRLCESRGVQLLWDTLSGLGSATTAEIDKLLDRCEKSNTASQLKLHSDLFEKVPRLPQDKRSRGFRWKVRQGSKRPEVFLQRCIDYKGYAYYNINKRHHWEHRLVIEQHLGRKLLPKENVHHKDGDRLNNDISNLEL